MASTVKGTLHYMAPELFSRKEVRMKAAIDHRAADMWSLGEMIYRMLTKTSAFPEYPDLFSYVVRPDFFPLQTLINNHISEQARDFIQAIMKPAPESRLTSEVALGHAWVRSLRRWPQPLALGSPMFPAS